MRGMLREITFEGGGVIPTTADSGRFNAVNSGTAGSVAKANGDCVLTMSNNNEVQTKCLYENDHLYLGRDELDFVEFDIKVNTVLGANSTFYCGVGTARNNDPTAMTVMALFSFGASGVISFECDDNVIDTAPVSTGITLVAGATTYTTVGINFCDQVQTIAPPGRSKGRFSNLAIYAMDSRRQKRHLLPNNLFDMSNIGTTKLQLFAQLQKTSSTDVGAVAIRAIRYGFRDHTLI